MHEWRQLTDSDVVSMRSEKNHVDIDRPYAFLVEPECTADGRIEDVATIFLTNRECPFRCVFCDLWKNTTDERVPIGAIPKQIDYAIERLPATQHIKLYNSGNFFDSQAIPPEDHCVIAERVARFDTVIVENHPKLCNQKCVDFAEFFPGQLEVAIGLETIHPEILPRLNKQMTLDDFARAVKFLRSNDISVRTFILLRPPTLTELEGIEWALKSIDYAIDLGVGCCSVVPMRAGNGLMDRLQQSGEFTPPTIRSMERVLEEGVARRTGRVFMDLWDVEQFYDCEECGPARAERIRQMNLKQQVFSPIECQCEDRA